MSLLDYERVRLGEAENLGVRVSALDAEVEKRRPKLEELDNGAQGQAIKFCEIEPCLMQVDGAQLLDEIEAAYKRHLVMHESGALAIAVWCVFAQFAESSSIRLASAFDRPNRAAEKRRSLKSPKAYPAPVACRHCDARERCRRPPNIAAF